MHIHLIIPGLLWPAASLVGPAAGLALPALAHLLGKGRMTHVEFEPYHTQLLRLFGDAQASTALADLRRRGESCLPPADDAHYLCADPVNLSFAREHLLLGEFPDDDIEPAEAHGLVAALNDTFGDLGHFELASPTRWYLRLNEPTSARLYPLHDVVGRPIKHFLPEGDDGRLWQRTLNELQIVLHNHPLNQAREASGKRPINSLWPWGAGTPPQPRPCSFAAVQAEGPLGLGLGVTAGLPTRTPDLASALNANTLVVVERLLLPARQLDLDRWRQSLIELERDWFAPLASALRQGKLRTLNLTAPGDRFTLQLHAGARDHWRFWRKPLALDALLKSLAPPPHLPDAAAP